MKEKKKKREKKSVAFEFFQIKPEKNPNRNFAVNHRETTTKRMETCTLEPEREIAKSHLINKDY